jgi:hypothetical protein
MRLICLIWNLIDFTERSDMVAGPDFLPEDFHIEILRPTESVESDHRINAYLPGFDSSVNQYL